MHPMKLQNVNKLQKWTRNQEKSQASNCHYLTTHYTQRKFNTLKYKGKGMHKHTHTKTKEGKRKRKTSLKFS